MSAHMHIRLHGGTTQRASNELISPLTVRTVEQQQAGKVDKRLQTQAKPYIAGHHESNTQRGEHKDSSTSIHFLIRKQLADPLSNSTVSHFSLITSLVESRGPKRRESS